MNKIEIEELINKRNFYLKRIKQYYKEISKIDIEIIELLESTGVNNTYNVRFVDKSLKIIWNGGSINFTARGKRRYETVRSVFLSPKKRMTENKLVSYILRDEDMTSVAVRQFAMNIDKHLSANHFPYRLKYCVKWLYFTE